MSLLVPNEGETRLLLELLDGGTSRETWTLKLFKSNTTPAETDALASNPYTEADFTNYVSKTLTRTTSGSTWSTPASGAPTSSWSGEAAVAESTYQQQSWTCGTTGNTVYGYWVEGVTSTKFIFIEKFGTARTLTSTDQLNLTPRMGLS